MIAPNKFIALDASILSKLEIILGEKIIGEMGIRELYRAVAHRFDTIDQFLLVLDVLYVLGRVNVDFKTEMVSHAG